MQTVSPPRRSTAGGPLIPFSVGADSFLSGRPLSFNPYAAGTVDHTRFVSGWDAARESAEAEAADVAREVAADAAAGRTTAASDA